MPTKKPFDRRCFQIALARRLPTMDRRVWEAIAVLRAGRGLSLRLPELSKAVGLRVRRVEQLFITQTGMTFVRFRREFRMHLARELLAQSSKSVKEIAATVGYGAVEVFCRDFRKYNGCTAMQFRKRYRDVF